MKILPGLCAIVVTAALPFTAGAWTEKAVADDALVRMPGTQPGQVEDLESDKQCLSCHGGFEMDHWRGSMMAQAGRDPLFWAGMTVAAQDAIWVVGTPNAADLCIRCHFPQGWLDGRSDPPNASLMRGEDYEGVSCKICHYMYDPFFKDTHAGTREGSDWTNYWDEVGPDSQTGADETYAADAVAAAAIKHFNTNDFFINDAPASASYTENGGGQFFVSTDPKDHKRGPFVDANAKHNMLYSRHHKSKYLCGACHDVSNPVLANLGDIDAVPGDGVTVLASEANSAFSYGHVERTFSEFMLSAYGAPGGSAGTGPYQPDRFETSRAGNKIASCQDCHFRDLHGISAGNSGVVRPDDSTDHPLSGVPEHRMIGGNAWVPYLLASIEPGSPNYDATNEALLKQGPATLTLDFTQGEALNPALLLETSALAAQMLQDAVSITNAAYSLGDDRLSLRIVNHTPHKLISGYPEGRRMFLNVKAYANGHLIYEINPYDDAIGTLKGLANSQSSPDLAGWEAYADELVFEVHQSSTFLQVDETFHMALATGRYKDNRIPPRGFDIAQASSRLCEPVWHGVADTNYFTAAEYAGGFDELSIDLPRGTERIEAALYYQTTSREFVEFLRDEINGTGGTLTGEGAGGDPPYIAQTNDWFSGLAAWGDTIWQLWEHNKDVPGAAPVLMTNSLVQLDVSDEDGDGIPAYWEAFHFGGATNADPTADFDEDGDDNKGEYLACTLPKDSNSVFRITAEVAPVGPDLEVTARFDSTRARTYALEETPDLTQPSSWNAVSGNVQGRDEVMGLAHTNSAGLGVYRVKAKLPGSP